VHGRIIDASNATLLCTVSADGVSAECVYKPVRGERPLWDFPDGTLADREVATYLVSAAADLRLVPPTVLREGPFGPGMVQLWVQTEPDSDLVDIVPPEEVPDGWRPVLHARDHAGEPVVLVHADRPAMRMLAVLDVVANNADRKGGHVLHAVGGSVYGIDHGICMHSENKLRTVLWGWLGEPLPEEAVAALHTLRAGIDNEAGQRLAQHLTRKELRALAHRVDRLLAVGVFPAPSGDRPAIPWPAF
jgi:uncharacterized repeat protein (TIGR03843 family)